MKKIVLWGVVIFSLVACTNNGRIEGSGDIPHGIADSALVIPSDSAKAKGEQTLDAIREKVKEIGTTADTLQTDSIH